MARLVLKVLRGHKDHKANKDHKVQLVQLVPPDHRGLRANEESKGRQDLKVLRGRRELLVQQAHKERRGHKDHKAHKVRKVQTATAIFRTPQIRPSQHPRQ